MINSTKEAYLSLDEARIVIQERWSNLELRKKIEEKLGDLFIEDFSKNPKGISFRQIITPDNGFLLFNYLANCVGVEPLVMEYKKDIFVSFNEEKKGLGKLRINRDGKRGYLNILDFHANEKKPLGEVLLKNNQLLIDFHHSLMNKFGYSNIYKDYSDWFKKFERASDYYYPLFLHCVAHGVFFETLDGDEYENNFTKTIMLPVMNRILNEFGVAPVVVKLYPDNQSAIEDYYWWSFPPFVNDYINSLTDINKLSTYNIINVL